MHIHKRNEETPSLFGHGKVDRILRDAEKRQEIDRFLQRVEHLHHLFLLQTHQVVQSTRNRVVAAQNRLRHNLRFQQLHGVALNDAAVATAVHEGNGDAEETAVPREIERFVKALILSSFR